MITEFAFTPIRTTEQMRMDPDIISKVRKINEIRKVNSVELIANGEEALEPYIFDYLLLCNKVCGASHYNMQMKIIVETEQEFNKWIKNQQTFAQFVQ
jgi:cytochrome c oxidase subunit 2